MNYGMIYEAQAAQYLKNKGFEIISRNARYAKSEVDIICKNNNELHIVEVKHRSISDFLSIKQAQLSRIERYMQTLYPGIFFKFTVLFMNNNTIQELNIY
jgi:Holliday junction resolvase-like predicted endonuclease